MPDVVTFFDSGVSAQRFGYWVHELALRKGESVSIYAPIRPPKDTLSHFVLKVGQNLEVVLGQYT